MSVGSPVLASPVILPICAISRFTSAQRAKTVGDSACSASSVGAGDCDFMSTIDAGKWYVRRRPWSAGERSLR